MPEKGKYKNKKNKYNANFGAEGSGGGEREEEEEEVTNFCLGEEEEGRVGFKSVARDNPDVSFQVPSEVEVTNES